MEKTHNENQPVKVVDAVVCDVCGKENLSSECGREEILRLRGDARFYSPFGHGTKWSLDICESCLIARLGEFIQKAPEEFVPTTEAVLDPVDTAKDLAVRGAALDILRDWQEPDPNKPAKEST